MDLMKAVDEGLNTVGGFKRWHMLIMTALGISSYATFCWQLLSILFTGWSPDHRCNIPEGSDLNLSIPLVKGKDEEVVPDSCLMFSNLSISNETTACTSGHHYYNTGGYYTIVQQWDLVCDRDYFPEMAQTILYAGTISGEIIFAFISDRIGRKWVHTFSLIAMTLFGTAVGLSANYVMYVITRLLVMFFAMGAARSGETLYLELFGTESRTFAGIMLQIYWTCGATSLGLFGYLIKDWRHMQIFVSLIGVIFLPYIWCLPESVMWLTANNKLNEGEKLLQKMAKWNGVPLAGRLLPETLMETFQVDKDKEKECKHLQNNHSDRDTKSDGNSQANGNMSSNSLFQSNQSDKINGNSEGTVINGGWNSHCSLQNNNDNKDSEKEMTKSQKELSDEKSLDRPGDPIDLVKDLLLLKHMFLFSLMWFVECVVYYALTMSAPSLPGDRFVNYTISSFVELPGFMVSFFVVRKSRRMTLVVFHFIITVFMVITAVIPKDNDSLGPLVIVCAMMGKLCNAVTFAALVLYGKECFPTNLRNSGAGIYGAWGGVGGMVAPFMAYLARRIPWLPYTILAVLCCFTGIVVMVLPETSGKPLPQSMRDCYRLYDKYEEEYIRSRTSIISSKEKEQNGLPTIKGYDQDGSKEYATYRLSSV